MYRLGIDVGGTNIDFAVVDQNDALLYGYKVLLQGDFISCLISGIKVLMSEHGFQPEKVSSIYLGTTLAMNSLLELKSLCKVGLIRLATHAPDFPPAYAWSDQQRSAILAGYETISGGREFNNAALKPLSEIEIYDAVTKLLANGAKSLALVSVFSPFYSEDELITKSLIEKRFGKNLPVSLSHQIGNLGFIERENTTILNATLKNVMRERFSALSQNLQTMGFHCECYITQNNGTLFTLEEAFEFPVKTIASGPTNSIIGASKLSHCHNAIVVDIGGTSTDIGVIEKGFPLYSLQGGVVAGIACHLRSPDVIALAMGGGSVIRRQEDGYTIGPDSLGAALFDQCESKSGKVLTLYDLGQLFKNPEIKLSVSLDEAEAIMASYLKTIKTEIKTMVPDADSKPIILVGGGSANIPDFLLDAQFIRPSNYQIANAYGAALSEISGHIDCIIQCEEDMPAEIERLQEEAKTLACQKGATRNSLRLIEKKVLPLYYMPERCYRVIVTVAGGF